MVVEIFVSVVTLTLIVWCVGMWVYNYAQKRTVSGIREEVYKLFLIAEHTWTETKTGRQKMNWVVEHARSMLPKWAQIFITEEVLHKMIQLWFDAVKDLLDDGKYNHSTEDGEQDEENEEQEDE